MLPTIDSENSLRIKLIHNKGSRPKGADLFHKRKVDYNTFFF